ANERAADGDLADMVREMRASRWPEATAALERARGRLGDRGSAGHRRLLEQGRDELRLTGRLNEIRLGGTVGVGGDVPINRFGADGEYEEAFRGVGLGDVHDDPAVVADRIRASNVTDAIVAALDHWSTCIADTRRKEWVLGVARLADRDR